jgi:hypothetical protein
MGAPRTAKHYRSDDDTVLDADMTADDLVANLNALHFAKDRRFHAVVLDRHVRDYLVNALRRRSESAQR